MFESDSEIIRVLTKDKKAFTTVFQPLAQSLFGHIDLFNSIYFYFRLRIVTLVIMGRCICVCVYAQVVKIL